MVHPCATDNPGTVMHACASEDSATTLCGLKISPVGINITAGYQRMCPTCFPRVRVTDPSAGDDIGGRDSAEAKPSAE